MQSELQKRFDYILIGGGVASVAAAQSIRERDGGSLLILKEEPRPPYDRPPLSKRFLQRREIRESDTFTKPESFYRERNIALRLSARATAINTAEQTVTIETGETLQYGKLLIATGATAKVLDVSGNDASNVITLRTLEDSLRLREAFEQVRRLVVVGAEYIGMEVAAAATMRGIHVTVVASEPYPFHKFAGQTFGNFVQSFFARKGVRFLLQNEVACIDTCPSTGLANSVGLKSGQPLPTDLIVVSIGAKLNLNLAIQAGLHVDENEGVHADEFLRTSVPNVFVAGDIAYFKDIALGKQWHAEHHLNAKWQGEAVGRIMAGEVEPYNRVAYFFSDLFDIHMVLRGDPQAATSKIVLGDLDGAEFIELYGDEEDGLKMGIAVSRDGKKLEMVSDMLDRLIRDGASIAQAAARLQDSDRASYLGIQSMAAVLGMLMGTDALRFSPLLTHH